MASAYAALRSLKCTLHTITNLTRFSISIDKTQMESLQEKVDFLIHFLETFSHRGNEKAQDLENRIADAAYNTEDAIESHVADEITGKTVNSFGLEFFIEDLDLIKSESMEMKRMSEMENWQSHSLLSIDLSSSTPIGKSSMMGFDDDLLSMKERITSNQSSRIVIHIIGMGGIGKTTLAKNVYDDKLIVEKFDIRVWVTISQEYDVKRIISQVYSHNCIPKYKTDGQMTEDQLREHIYKALFGRRYLVILDDMWEIEAWNKLQSLFPNNGNGSRIILTTRNSHLATHFDSGVHRLNFLDEDKSWNLFCQEAFGEKGCPVEELEEVGRKISKNCKGLPLSIVVIGGLLAKSDKTKAYWEYVANDLHSVANLEDNASAMKILSLSYHSLPIHLKPCFLYVGAFREDETIEFSRIIRLCVAEGFLKPMIDKDLEVVGEEYLNDLLSRNLLIRDHHVDRYTNEKYFKIHDSFRDLCLRECQSQEFMHIRCLDPLQCMKRPLRICNHANTSEGEYANQIFHSKNSLSCLRCLLCYNNKRSILDFFPLGNPKILRILDTHYDFTHCSEENIVSLVNSRNIIVGKIDGYPDKAKLPSALNLLWNLQFLVLLGLTECFAPSEFWKMTQLRHVEVRRFHLPDPPVQDNFVLENLHTLKKVVDFRCTEEVVRRIPNIKELGVAGVFEEDYFKNLGRLWKLELLDCYFEPAHMLSRTVFPTSLKRLELRNIVLDWGDLTHIGSLPYLEMLSLYDVSKCTPVWELNDGEFSRLKELHISECDIVKWRADSTHFPRLEQLFLFCLEKLEEIPIGIGEIPTLQSIRLAGCSESCILSAKAILGHLEEESGDVSLQVYVICYENEELKSNLTNNNNFCVRWI